MKCKVNDARTRRLSKDLDFMRTDGEDKDKRHEEMEEVNRKLKDDLQAYRRASLVRLASPANDRHVQGAPGSAATDGFGARTEAMACSVVQA
jgi:hypothetical protein